MPRSLVKTVLLAAVVCAAATSSFSSSLVPAVASPGFEEGSGGWEWIVRGGARTSFSVSTEDPHSGKNCISFRNDSGLGPDTYGRFWTRVSVLPAAKYEISCWARGRDVAGKDAASHFTDWLTYTMNLPIGTFPWQKVSTVVETQPGQTVLALGLNIIESCKELAIDDVTVKPVGTELKGEGVTGSFLTPLQVIGHNSPGYFLIMVDSDKAASIESTVSAGTRKIYTNRSALKPGESTVELKWNSGNSPFGQLDATVRVVDASGKTIAQAIRKVENVDSPVAAAVEKIEKRYKDEFLPLYDQCRAKGFSLDYPTVTKTMLEQFIPYAVEDAQNGMNWRAEYATRDFNRSIDESTSLMKAYLNDPKLVPNVRRYQTGSVKIEGFDQIGSRIDSAGKKDQGKLFFVGFGHFSQILKDMSKWPGYGTNLIQACMFFIPSVLPEEGKVSLDNPKLLVKALDDAAKNNVAVDFIIPQNLPDWAFKKWPHVGKGGGGWFNFVPDEEESKMVYTKFLQTVIPMIKDKPALHSICLSNEPLLNNTANADNTRPMWNAYLEKVHGDIKILNQSYGANYKSFDEVPVGGGFDDPQFVDWVSFNNERFAGWHKWMADAIHEIAPKVPVHVKVMSNWLNRDFVASGCDPELFGAAGQFNGNDCYFVGSGGPGWAAPWHYQNIGYDIQRSLAQKPIFNSENHLCPDRGTSYVPPEHFRTALWQGAVHGQGSTTIWAWERTYDQTSDFYGLVMDRPGCAEAVGRTCLDLNRFADEVSAIQNAKSPVAVLYSIASLARDPGYANAVNQVYAALCFHGFKVDFISEKQIQEGKGKDYRVIVFPESGHAYRATFDAIRNLPESVKLIAFGESLIKDPYNKAFPQDQLDELKKKLSSFSANPDGQSLFARMHEELKNAGALPEVSIVDAFTGEPVWGLEWLPAKIGDRTVVSIVNLREQQACIKILVGGNRVQARDLLSLGGRDYVRVIKPITPVLAELED